MIVLNSISFNLIEDFERFIPLSIISRPSFPRNTFINLASIRVFVFPNSWTVTNSYKFSARSVVKSFKQHLSEALSGLTMGSNVGWQVLLWSYQAQPGSPQTGLVQDIPMDFQPVPAAPLLSG